MSSAPHTAHPTGCGAHDAEAGDHLIGSEAWLRATGGNLSARERRALLRPVVAAQLSMMRGRTASALRLNGGRHGTVEAAALLPPDSSVAREAEQAARELLTPGLVAHSHRSYLWAAALAARDGLAFDRELLYVAAMLHDTGLPTPTQGVDFTAASLAHLDALELPLGERQRRIVADAVASHHTPGLDPRDGVERFLLGAGTGLDVLGLRTWDLPFATRRTVLDAWPRTGFPAEFRALWAQEARRVPKGRAAYLRRWAAFDLAMRIAALPR